MSIEARRLVAKLWHYWDVLRDDSVSTIDYIEQLTYLIFLKMAHERANRPLNPDPGLRHVAAHWQRLLDCEGDDLANAYEHTLAELATEPGVLGVIFRGAQNKILHPAKLKRLVVDFIRQECWTSTSMDVKGDAYEDLLATSAEDVKSEAGRHFTPRALISAIVDCIQPGPDDIVFDPACGTGGFLLGAYHYIHHHHGGALTPDQREGFAQGKISGVELADGPARLAAMNMLLHGIGHPNGPSLIDVRDALAQPHAGYPTVILTNPLFEERPSGTVVRDDGRADRADIAYQHHDVWTTTTNKQLNFVQHIAAALAMNGRAAVVVPDSVLFEGGAGETVRRRLLAEFDVHTLLRLPTGIFYADGVKANVLFFDKKPPRPDQPWTSALWVYDFRVSQNFTREQNPLRREHLDDFVASFRPGEPHDNRIETKWFSPFSYDELATRTKSDLDITWLQTPSPYDANGFVDPDAIVRKIVENLQATLAEFSSIAEAVAARPPSADPSEARGTEPPRY